SVSAVLIGTEVLTHLFPEKSGALVHALAVLMIAASLFSGILHMDLDFSFESLTQAAEIESQDTPPLYAETGTALLRERLYTLLDAAGISVEDGAEGVEIWYNQDESGAVEIDRVRVCVSFSTDIDRAAALLRNVLTDAIRTEVYAA
ncbi:MAG: hypothetical protein ACI4GO_07035, partial [Hominenteromicrobium sp.]